MKIKEFCASDKNSFAFFTIKERFPENYKKCGLSDYEETIEKTVKEGLGNRPQNLESHPGWNAIYNATKRWHNETIKDFFFKAPFFLVEFYFYHLLLVKKNFAENRIDFFASNKDFDLLEINNEMNFQNAMKNLFAEKSTEDKSLLKTVLNFSLTGNTADLSQLSETKENHVQVLHDDSDQCYVYLSNKKKNKQIDIICDNSGRELFSDLYLAVFMILHNYAKKVILHVKPCPFFVSDATAEDFGKLVNLITKDKDNKPVNQELLALLNKDCICVREDVFWVEPKCFNRMPNRLKHHFKKSSLIVVKGDLNYRRLVQDKNWNYDDSFAKRILLRKRPVLSPRVLKSDLIVGVSPAMNSFAKSQENQYQRNGKFGVIHFCCKKTNYKIKQVPNNAQLQQYNENEKKRTRFIKFKLEKKYYFYYLVLFFIVVLIIFTLGTVSISYLKLSQTENVVNIKTKTEETTDTKSETGKTTKNQSGTVFEPISFERVDFSLMLTGLVIFISASVLLPEVIMDKKIKDSVEKLGKETAEEYIKKSMASEIHKVTNELNKTDAHLSRMIALGLSGNYPIWSIGWVFRSLKRYQRLDSNQVGFEEYYDFIDFMRLRIISVAIEKFIFKLNKRQNTLVIKRARNNKQDNTLDDVWKILKNEQTDGSGKKYEFESVRAVIRCIKEIVDLEYSLFEDLASKVDDNAKGILKNFSLLTGDFCRLLCAVCIDNYANDVMGTIIPENEKDGVKILLKEILKISDYGIKGKSAINEEIKADFKSKLELEFNDIRMQQEFPVNLSANNRFFRHKETFKLDF